jgi:hypothetical protein
MVCESVGGCLRGVRAKKCVQGHAKGGGVVAVFSGLILSGGCVLRGIQRVSKGFGERAKASIVSVHDPDSESAFSPACLLDEVGKYGRGTILV